MTFIDLFEFCNRKTSKHRSINSPTNHSIFRWFLSLHWLFFGSFMLCLIYFVSFCDTLFRFVSFLHFSFRFVLWYFFSFLHFSFHFFIFRFVSLYFVSFRFVFVSQFSSTLSCQLKFKICCFIQFFESLLSFFRLPGQMPCDLLPLLGIHRIWKIYTFKSSYFSGTT
jgi:hypothetical protein